MKLTENLSKFSPAGNMVFAKVGGNTLKFINYESPPSPILYPTSHTKLTPSKALSLDTILQTTEFSNFVNAAKEFCSFIESEGKLAGSEFLRVAQARLVTLYSYGKHLPSVHLQVDKDYESAIDDSVMKPLLRSISDRVPFSYYWLVLNPNDINNSAETGTGDLIDDLGDIYKDLKRAIIVFDIDDKTAKANAIYKFKFNFDCHWNKHCIEALFAIHHYLAGSK